MFRKEYIDTVHDLIPVYHDEENEYLKGGYTDEKMGDALVRACNKY
jgi:hypothetical protein